MDKKELKLLLTESIENVLAKLEDIVSTDSPLFDNLIIAKARYSDLQREINNGLLTPIEKNIEMNKIRGTTLFIINSLENFEPANDFKSLNIVIQQVNVENELVKIEEEELGLFDLEELYISSTKELTKALERMSEDIKEMGVNIQEDANKLNTLYKSNPNPNRVLVKKIVSNAASTMTRYGNRLAIETPIFKETTESSVNYALQYITKLYEFDIKLQKDDVIEFESSINNLISISKVSRNGLIGMVEEIKRVPGLTSEFVKAKKKVLIELDQFFKDYNEYLDKLDQLDKNVETILLEISDD